MYTKSQSTQWQDNNDLCCFNITEKLLNRKRTRSTLTCHMCGKINIPLCEEFIYMKLIVSFECRYLVNIILYFI